MFQQEIVRLHGYSIQRSVVDRDPRFTSSFLDKVYQKAWEPGSSLYNLFILNTRRQRIVYDFQTLEDMLRIMKGALDGQEIANVELLCWELGRRTYFLRSPEMIEVTNEKVVVARRKLKEAQTLRNLVTPTRTSQSVRSFQPGPFEILDRVGEVSYRLALPPQLSHVHNVFHYQLLRRAESYSNPKQSHEDRTIPLSKILWQESSRSGKPLWETEGSKEHDFLSSFSSMIWVLGDQGKLRKLLVHWFEA
ncbi:hypothetical protein Tco_1097582 [Tanacetum coccineum]